MRRLDIGAVVVGADFHFGKGRSGSPQFLQRAGERFGFAVEIADKVEAGGEVISSSAIRKALERGDVAAADAHARPAAISVSGAVIAGQKLGRTLGVPTANLGAAADQPPRLRRLCGAGAARRAAARRRREFRRAPDGRQWRAAAGDVTCSISPKTFTARR